jgi:diguanylate cyclase (GGDEF)-like protein
VPDGCSATCVPVNILGRTAGVVHAVGAKHDLLTGNRDAGIRALANSAGDVLGMLRAFATKDRQANTDSLTGLDNRRSLEAKLPEIMARGAYTVAFADLDKFKQLNDTHGHDMGDKALRLFADVLRGSVRPDDLVGRWGGEEFVIVLPGSTDEKAVRVVHRMRERLKEALAIGAVPNFTASFGLCDSRDAETFGDVINAADAALLRAKEEGRDRIIYGVIGEGDARVVEDLLATPPEDTGPYRRVSAA